MKIRWKIFLSVIITTAALFVTVIALLSNNFRKYTLDRSQELAQAYAKQAGNRAQAVLEKDMSAMRTLADAFSGYAKIPYEQRKPIYEDMMRSVLKNHPKYNSVWISWELNAINDKWYKSHGRQRTLVLKNPNGSIDIKIDSLELEQENFSSIYYAVKTSEEREFIIDPYFFSYDSEEYPDSILMSSIAVHVRDKNQYKGLVGLDVGLTELQDIISARLPLESAQTILISNNGTVVAHPNERYIGKNLENIISEENISRLLLSGIAKGEMFSFVSSNLHEEGEAFVTFSSFSVGESETPWAVAVTVPLEAITQEAYNNFYNSLLIGLISLVLLSGIIFIISANITRPLNRTAELMQTLEKGDIRLRTDRSMKRKDEVGEMSRSVRKLLEKLNDTVQFAIKIGKGDFDAKYELESKDDRLGKALIDMQNNLRRVEKERASKEEENLKNIWIQTGITKLGEILQENYQDYRSLTEVTVKFLVKHLDIPQAAIFVSEYEGKFLKNLNLSSAYAYDRMRNVKESFAPGESLVGRCAEEMKIITVTDIPDEYTVISSGLGREKPTFLMLLPLINDRRVQGVLELASFSKLPEHKVEFLEVSAERLAAEILNITNDLETAKILEQLEEQSKRMSEKEDEAKNVIKELEQTTDRLDRQRFENKKIIEALSSVTSVVFFDVQGRITDLNQKNMEMFGVKKEDYIGKTHFDILSEAKEKTEWFEAFWDDLRNGKTREKEYYISRDDSEMWLHETFIPIKGRTGVVKQIINIGIDITQQRLLERKLDELQNKH